MFSYLTIITYDLTISILLFIYWIVLRLTFLASKVVSGKPSGILSFGIKVGEDAGINFIDSLKLVKRLVNIGDAKSLACHPASTTHRQLNDEELKSTGTSRDMIRISVGIEFIEDILFDINQALENTK